MSKPAVRKRFPPMQNAMPDGLKEGTAFAGRVFEGV